MGGIVSPSAGISQQFWDEYRRDFESVGLTYKAIGRFNSIFYRCKTGIGFEAKAPIEKLLYKMGIGENQFMKRAFKILEVEKPDDSITFRQFAFVLWNFLSMPSKNEFLGLFAFDLFNDGVSSPCKANTIKSIFKTIYSQSRSSMMEDIYIIYSGVESKIDGFNTTGPEGMFTSEDFARFCGVHPLAIAPLRKLHMELQKAIMGKKFWDHSTYVRSSISQGMYVPISIMLERFKSKRPEVPICAPVNKMEVEYGTTKLPPELLMASTKNNATTSSSKHAMNLNHPYYRSSDLDEEVGSRMNTSRLTPRSDKNVSDKIHAGPVDISAVSSRRHSASSSGNSRPSSGLESRKQRLDAHRNMHVPEPTEAQQQLAAFLSTSGAGSQSSKGTRVTGTKYMIGDNSGGGNSADNSSANVTNANAGNAAAVRSRRRSRDGSTAIW
jgi:hypothetical protein